MHGHHGDILASSATFLQEVGSGQAERVGQGRVGQGAEITRTCLHSTADLDSVLGEPFRK